jgi:hypothetical protein
VRFELRVMQVCIFRQENCKGLVVVGNWLQYFFFLILLFLIFFYILEIDLYEPPTNRFLGAGHPSWILFLGTDALPAPKNRICSYEK